ncbi:peptidylprolyl isomerase [Spirochaeta isovalerica]|uniref:peptidylprolyl isomerase n=1 Tax=Spirochaeta isovalerica TaxID=150 RepID=A0A841RFL5_9SPIO|nr:peptidylprolyl isomerase [Spirochaeta isovalerica]MBB6482386.1 peptidylprolyl isomerase [Spirochaeta isovalerica]
MIKRIWAVITLLLISTVLLSAKGQTTEDLYKDGESLLNPGIYAKIATDKGTMIFDLDYETAPLTVLNFINVAEEGFYDGMEFYREIENYALFAGDPANNGSSDIGYNFPVEMDSSLTYDQPGLISMDAVSGMSSGSRFFISKTTDSVLNGKYTAFGRLVEGNAVLAKLKRGQEILSVEIVRTDSDALSFQTDQDTFNRLSKVALDRQLETFKTENPDVFAAIDALGEGVQKTLTGIYYNISREGNGIKAQNGDTVSVHYTAMLIDGTVFDSSISRGQPFEFTVGTQSVIAGWDETLLSMSIGEQRSVIIPPNLAYGDVQAGPIAPNSWLLFQVELLDIK